jgi:O-acetyl-ADP-ribose deacetylase (regulator of RNase III)
LQLGGNERIDEGQSVWINGVGDYKHLIHIVPPFFNNGGDDARENRLLQTCYQTSLSLAADRLPSETDIRIACPLLGAGCRGFPSEEAIFHCAEALSDLKLTLSTPVDGDKSTIKGMTLAFGVPSQDIREAMIKAFDNRITFTAL